jgi:hypothetical protein
MAAGYKIYIPGHENYSGCVEVDTSQPYPIGALEKASLLMNSQGITSDRCDALFYGWHKFDQLQKWIVLINIHYKKKASQPWVLPSTVGWLFQ